MDFSKILISLAHASPALIAFLIAGIVALVNLNKHKTPALLVLIGSLLGGLTLIGSVIVREILWEGARKEGNFERVATLTSVIGIAGNVVVAVGITMIALAVFTGRKQVLRDDDDDRPRRPRRDEPPMARPSRPSD